MKNDALGLKGLPKTLEGFKGWEFSTGSTVGKDFDRFATLFKEEIKESIPEDARLVEFSKGHYILSGFIERNGKYVYFSVSDVRYFEGEWTEKILIRTAESDEDYTGGVNNFTTLEKFEENVERLL